MADIGFYGAAGSVTGSRHLVTSGDERVLIDCGMYQGPKKLRLPDIGDVVPLQR